MKMRILADLIISDIKQAETLFNQIKNLTHLYETINPNKPEEERSTWSLHKCYHDETPVKPCEYVEEYTSK